MTDRLAINNLEIWTHIGVSADERQQEQKLVITVVLELDTTLAGTNDDINATIDYQPIVKDLHRLAAMEHKTIEGFAHETANLILSNYQPSAVEVTINKFFFSEADSISLTIRRS